MTNPIFVAIDTPDLAAAEKLADSLRPHIGGIKLGLEFFLAHGVAGYRAIAAKNIPIFLDLKLHDIPNTVAGAIASLLPLQPNFLTIHAAGGPAMLRAAADAAAKSPRRPKLLAVTVLTSLDSADLAATGQDSNTQNQVIRLARLAQANGIDGVICSPEEVAPLRAALGPDFILMVPGIRPEWAESGDQKRVMTPRQAGDAGATYLVIGRPITKAADPAAAAQRIRTCMSIAVKICGLIDADAVAAAVDSGARYTGFVFYPKSPRHIDTEQAAALIARVPAHISTVGLFVDPPDELLIHTLRIAKLNMIQLHGNESPQRVAAISQLTGLPIIKAVGIASAADLATARAYESVADLLLLDAKPASGGLPGGNAVSFDWTLLRNARFAKPWLLAGGLTIANLAEAVATTGAQILDVSSGVEDAPGHKNPTKIRQFIAAASQIP